MTATATDVNQWLSFTLAGLQSPGTIPRGGIKGFKRETGWDIKKGKGVKGATLTLTSQPPCHGSITLQLIGPGGFYADGTPSTDFAQWDTFVAEVLTSETAAQQQAQGLAIYYPGFASINLTSVVVAHFTGPEHVGKGLYTVAIDLIEWTPPPPVSVVSTVSSQKQDSDSGAPAKPQDPRIVAAQQRLAAAQASTQGPGFVGPT